MKYSVLLSAIISMVVFNATSLKSQEKDYDFVVNSDGGVDLINDERGVIKECRLYTSYVTSERYVGMSVYDLEKKRRYI